MSHKQLLRFILFCYFTDVITKNVNLILYDCNYAATSSALLIILYPKFLSFDADVSHSLW